LGLCGENSKSSANLNKNILNVDDEYDDQWDDQYDENAKDTFSSRDKKKRERQQVNSQFGKRGTKEREQKSEELHKDKRLRGGGNNVNKEYGELGEYNEITSSNSSWWYAPVGVAIVVVAGVATVVLIVDDATVVGVGDDVFIPATAAATARGFQMIMAF
jgi:hypothetical protein